MILGTLLAGVVGLALGLLGGGGSTHTVPILVSATISTRRVTTRLAVAAPGSALGEAAFAFRNMNAAATGVDVNL